MLATCQQLSIERFLETMEYLSIRFCPCCHYDESLCAWKYPGRELCEHSIIPSMFDDYSHQKQKQKHKQHFLGSSRDAAMLCAKE